MLRIMYIISARELKIAAIFIFFLSTYFCEFLKKQKTRLKDNFETSYNNPRYHSNCRYKIYHSSKSINFYALTQHSREVSTGCLNLSGFQLRSDKNSTVLYRDRTIPGSLINSLQVPSSSTLLFRFEVKQPLCTNVAYTGHPTHFRFRFPAQKGEDLDI